MTLGRQGIIMAGVALWLPLLVSLLGALRMPTLPGVALSQLAMVGLLVCTTLLLGMLIGRGGCLEEPLP